MSALSNQLSEADLKAPSGHFRVVKKYQPKIGLVGSARLSLVEDFPEKHDAIVRWRHLSLEMRRAGEENLRYSVYDDQGRIVDAVGTHITEEDRRAPPGKFRIVCVDFALFPPVIKLVDDLDDKAKAIEYGMAANEGPYTGFQVHDDSGAALLPVG